jgi:hypothetical protein
VSHKLRRVKTPGMKRLEEGLPILVEESQHVVGNLSRKRFICLMRLDRMVDFPITDVDVMMND